jgi:hypothetical protein
VATESLNNFVVWLALPALLFQAMAKITWRELDHPGFLAAFTGGMMLTFLLSFLLGRRRDRLAGYRLGGEFLVPGECGVRHFDVDFERRKLVAVVEFDVHLVAVDGDMLRNDCKDFLLQNGGEIGAAGKGALMREQELQALPRDGGGAVTGEEA